MRLFDIGFLGSLMLVACSSGVSETSAEDHAAAVQPAADLRAPSSTQGIQTVFMILMENHNWSQIKGNPSAPYINGTLLPAGSHAEQYQSTPHIHPSEPNYIWLEAGSNLGVTNDKAPGIVRGREHEPRTLLDDGI